MNKLINKPLVAILASGILLSTIPTGCKKSSNNGSGSAVSASFSSGSFSSQQSQAFYSKSQAAFVIGGYTIVNGDTSVIELDLTSNVTLNTPVTFANGQSVYYYDSKGTFYFSGDVTSGHGSVTITSWDTTHTKLTGTFTGVLPSTTNASDSLVINNGQFNVTYIAEP
ncbi:hypothetical protein [Dinghuibacter silviterrae]|uniref:Uncharacterized protein n=1 Tax=Dinghuibacter silviterrae TaxID=1539049 RepID=A0A4R8DVF3_9BACT|nr:hypothetical protein [Dinghuibacter silviterrae]TDX02410.1 hypothetical protein EDB95_3468 [Dinghuibacter silviterrae]